MVGILSHKRRDARCRRLYSPDRNTGVEDPSDLTGAAAADADTGVEAPAAEARTVILVDLGSLLDLALATVCCIAFETHPVRRSDRGPMGHGWRTVEEATLACFSIMVRLCELRYLATRTATDDEISSTHFHPLAAEAMAQP